MFAPKKNKESNNVPTSSLKSSTNDIHRLIALSQSRGVGIETIVNRRIPVMFSKENAGGHFIIAVPIDAIDLISEPSTRSLLNNNFLNEKYQCILLGEIIQHTKSPEDYDINYYADGELLLNDIKTSISKQFWHLISHYRNWDTFTSFLYSDIAYDVNTMPYQKQISLMYYVLVGSPSPTNNIYLINHSSFNGNGLYINSIQKKIPVFSSSLYADIAAQELRGTHGISLTPLQLPCIGCYLGGLYHELSSKKINGVILNDQWEISCFRCNTNHHGISGAHYFLHDSNGHAYSLIGCRDKNTMPPIWVEQKWDNDKRLFSPECQLIPW
jgi:hypothetical protein